MICQAPPAAAFQFSQLNRTLRNPFKASDFHTALLRHFPDLTVPALFYGDEQNNSSLLLFL